MLESEATLMSYPYVVCVSRAAHSLDCSSYVSWLLTNTGGALGRLRTLDLSNPSSLHSAANGKPDYLVESQGTVDTRRVTHLGFPLGSGLTLHLGFPLSPIILDTRN